jgi:hypothetical protein
MTNMTMNRRSFVILGTVGLAGVSIPSAYSYINDFKYAEPFARPESLSLIMEPQTIRLLGEMYLLQRPYENSDRALLSLISEGGADHSNPSDYNLASKIRRDFVTGNTIVIDGWILSLTEARQCALFSMSKAE